MGVYIFLVNLDQFAMLTNPINWIWSMQYFNK